MMKRFLLAVALLAFPAVTWAQPQPVSPFPSVPMPVFGQPSVNGGNINPSKVGVDASTCAAPGVYLTSAPTTGIAFTATPSVILCVNGTAIVTTTGSAVTSTVPFLGPDGTSAAPTFSFSGETTLGIYKSASSGLGVTTTGYSPGPAVQFGSASLNFGSVYALSFASGIAATNAPDTFLLRGAAAATLQMGVNAAGVTDQLFKGPDRITSDGVGGNLTIAGGRNRGASAGGSVIIQTAPAAGAGVAGTLATALTIDSTKLATFAGGIVTVAGGLTTTPLSITNGTNLTTATANAIENDGTRKYWTQDTTNGRTVDDNWMIYRLDADSTGISGIADFFAATGSGVPLVANGFYELEYHCVFTQATAGTATWTIVTATTALAYLDASYIGTNIAGAGTVGAPQMAGVNTTSSSSTALPVTGTEATGVTHIFEIHVMLKAGNGASNTRLRLTMGAGTATPKAGSYVKVRRLPTANTGSFVS